MAGKRRKVSDPSPSVPPRRRARQTTVQRFRNFRWQGIALERYKAADADTWSGISRQVLIAGSRGAALGFDVRYFEIEAGGHSTLEFHAHAHVLIGVRGHGEVRVGRRWQAIDYLDTCYVPPRATHQLRNRQREPFGFLCLVDAERDVAIPLRAANTRTRKRAGG